MNSLINASDDKEMEESELPGNNFYDFKLFTKSRFKLFAENIVIRSGMDVVDAEELFLGYACYNLILQILFIFCIYTHIYI